MRMVKVMFEKIITDLKAKGMTLQQIADAVGTSAPTIHRIQNSGQVPSWPLGDALVRLHQKMTAPHQEAA